MPKKLLKEVADYCWSNKFLDVFRKFFHDHGSEFVEAPSSLNGGEHDLKYYTLFQSYLKIYESTLEKYLLTLDCPLEEFYQEVRDAQNQSEDIYIQTFIDCLLASADYDSFYKVMAREGTKVAAIKAAKTPIIIAADTKGESKSIPIHNAEADAKSESKSPEKFAQKKIDDDEQIETKSYKK